MEVAGTPWTRQANEEVVAYQAFLRYLIEPSPRSVGALAKKLAAEGDREPWAVNSNLKQWSTAYHWKDRACAFDEAHFNQRQQEIAKLETADQEAVIHQHRERAKKLGVIFDKKIGYVVGLSGEESDTNEIMVLAKAFAMMTQHERIAFGLPGVLTDRREELGNAPVQIAVMIDPKFAEARGIGSGRITVETNQKELTDGTGDRGGR
jgi:hypothetical protein